MSTPWLFDPLDLKESSERVFTVAEINGLVRHTLETHWPNISVRGELTDVKRHRSGHVYFTLNDQNAVAQLRCVMFRSDAMITKANLEDGARVRLSGGLTMYEARGTYQLIVHTAVPEGEGDLKAQFDRLRKKLETEGLIDPSKRRALPRIPITVGIVSSSDGAAFIDILRVASKRFPLRLVLAPCTVQGKNAPASITKALLAIQRLPELDVVIVTRGGGSAEDLAAFNDEGLARAIAACRVPVVSAVGHEVDVTIADLVADLRAATPSHAAELVVPDKLTLQHTLASETRALQRAMDAFMNLCHLRLERLCKQIEDPRHSLAKDRTAFTELETRLRACMERLLVTQRNTLERLYVQLQALSPLGILARGYAIAIHDMSGKVLLNADKAEVGDAVSVRLHQGSLRTRVEQKE